MHLNKLKNFITNWINAYSKENEKNLIVGISGGIDSALTSTLCAMTNLKTFIVSIPIHQKKRELHRANKHMEWLLASHSNVETITIELDHVFDAYKGSIPSKYQSELALANSKARLRMTTLYQIATTKNGIVVGTGNKVEDFGIGFFTKYGDGGVDISPIGDLNKSEVRSLAKFCGISQDILEADPTDGLWEDGRTDETQIGATYKELEWAMSLNEKRKALTKREQTVLEIYNTLHTQNQHKMTEIPICNIPNEIRP